MVELERRTNLLDPPSVKHNDLGGERHGFDLVMGHVDHGRLQLLMQSGQLQARLYTQRSIKVRQWLIEKENFSGFGQSHAQ